VPPVDRPDLHHAALVERLRTACFAAVLPGVAVAEDEDFFQAGGDSVQLIRVVLLAQAELGIELRPSDFFVNPTLRTLADLAARALAAHEEAQALLLESVLDQVESEAGTAHL